MAGLKMLLTDQNSGSIDYKKIVIYLVTGVMTPLIAWLTIDFRNSVALADTEIASSIQSVDDKYDSKIERLEKEKVSIDTLRNVLDIQAQGLESIMERRDEKLDLIYEELKRVRDKVESK